MGGMESAEAFSFLTKNYSVNYYSVMSRTRTPAEKPRINVPVPRSIRERARTKAKKSGKSMSTLITDLLREYVGEKRAA